MGEIFAIDYTALIKQHRACKMWHFNSIQLKTQISVGHCGVWGINSEQSVFYRLNSYGDPDNEGTGDSCKNNSVALRSVDLILCNLHVKRTKLILQTENILSLFKGWVKVEGKFQQIYSGSECVLALAGNRDIYYRANVFEREGKVCKL